MTISQQYIDENDLFGKEKKNKLTEMDKSIKLATI
jgi:hypothetical protein